MDQLPGDGQAKASTTVFSGRAAVALVKGIKNPCTHIFRDTDPGVLYNDETITLSVFRTIASFKRNRDTALIGELDRVADQI